jgi:hypothetical protein
MIEGAPGAGTIGYLCSVALHEITHAICLPSADGLGVWDRAWLDEIVSLRKLAEEEEASRRLKDEVLASFEKSTAYSYHTGIPSRFVVFEEDPRRPLFLYSGLFWGWFSERLDKYSRSLSERLDHYTRSKPVSLWVVRRLSKVLGALVRVALGVTNTPKFLVKVLLTERSFFECHGLGRPPSPFAAMTWKGLPQGDSGRMHSTELVPA